MPGGGLLCELDTLYFLLSLDRYKWGWGKTIWGLLCAGYEEGGGAGGWPGSFPPPTPPWQPVTATITTNIWSRVSSPGWFCCETCDLKFSLSDQKIPVWFDLKKQFGLKPIVVSQARPLLQPEEEHFFSISFGGSKLGGKETLLAHMLRRRQCGLRTHHCPSLAILTDLHRISKPSKKLGGVFFALPLFAINPSMQVSHEEFVLVHYEHLDLCFIHFFTWKFSWFVSSFLPGMPLVQSMAWIGSYLNQRSLRRRRPKWSCGWTFWHHLASRIAFNLGFEERIDDHRIFVSLSVFRLLFLFPQQRLHMLFFVLFPFHQFLL